MPVVLLGNTWLGWVFALLATAAGVFYLQASIRFQQETTDQNARRLLRVSVLYLPLYMLLLVVFSQLGK
jgi:heme O synthase-like polyprenyltransferase